MRVKLEDVCERGSSNLRQSDVEDMQGDYPIYGASGYIGNADFYQQDKPYVAVVKDGAGIGRTMLLPAKSSVIGTMQYLVPKNNVIAEYLYYVVQHMRLEKYFSGATIPHIYFKDYKSEEFNLDNLENQKKIVTVLKKVENIINFREEVLEELDTLIKAQFVELFGDEKNSKKYPVLKIKDVADVQVGVVVKPAQYYTDARNGVKAFRSLNVGEMYIKDEEWIYFSDEGQRKNAKSILRENDLVIVRSGSPGTACVVTKEYEGSNAVDVIIAHPDTDIINPYYLCAFTNYPHGRHQIEEGTGGAAQQHFNVGKYKEMDLIYPPIEEQKRFVSFIKEIDKSKAAIQESLNETQLLFDSLMQEYFGK